MIRMWHPVAGCCYCLHGGPSVAPPDRCKNAMDLRVCQGFIRTNTYLIKPGTPLKNKLARNGCDLCVKCLVFDETEGRQNGPCTLCRQL